MKTIMNKNNQTIENLFSQVRNDIAVPSYGSFYAKMQHVTKPEGVRNTLRGWKLIPSMRIWIGVTLAVVIVLPVVYSVQAPQVPDPVVAAISDEGNHEIETLINEDEFISTILDRYLQQLETMNG
jgi:hypothetical protein